jgi:hypothetical protein
MTRRSKRERVVLDADPPNHILAQAICDWDWQRTASDDMLIHRATRRRAKAQRAGQ